MKTLFRPVVTIGIAVAFFVLIIFVLSPRAGFAYCRIDQFISCRDSFNLQGCIDSCPFVPIACPPGTPPDTECKETDQSCVDKCWETGDLHGLVCAGQSGCTDAEIEAYLKSGRLPAQQPPTSAAPTTRVETQEKTQDEPKSVTKAVEDTDLGWEIADIPNVEALAETKPKPGPSKEELKKEYERLKSQYEKMVAEGRAKKIPKGLDTAFITSMGGLVQHQFEGDATWKNTELGTPVWTGTFVQTDFDAEVTLLLPDGSTVTFSELTQVAIESLFKEREEAKRKLGLNIKLGDMNMDVNAGNFSADTQIRAGNNTGAVRGTDFSVAYDPETGMSVWEIYDGTIEVTNEETGETVTMSSAYGEPIKRLEAGDDGTFTRKVAVPKDEWRRMNKTGLAKNLIVLYVASAVLLLIATTYFIIKKKKLIKRKKRR